MGQIRRTRYVFFTIDNGPCIDIHRLLRGEAAISRVNQIYAVSLLLGDEYPITLDELKILFAVPAEEWIPSADAVEKYGLPDEALERFVRQGLLLTDESDQMSTERRRKDELLSSGQWNIYAALYHFMTRWRDVNVHAHLPVDPAEWKRQNVNMGEVYAKFIEKHGRPPGAFHTIANPLATVELPLAKRDDGIFATLSKRKTVRTFNRDVSLTQEQLSLILYYVFGCHGLYNVFEDIVAIKKTSPSGGGLHPTEVYPLILNVEGVQPGAYHYNIKDHSLDLMIRLERSEAEEWADEFTAGQSYPRSVQALFVMTSRFYRNFWKYRKHQKAYSVLLMDAAHLSQTFYLVCTDLGLGPFVTGAINSINIDKRLGLDSFEEGAIVVCGCGKPAEIDPIGPDFRPYP